MGLIKAASGSVGGVMADQWKEYFYSEALPAEILAVKGRKKVTKRSSNTKGDENIITSGSVIAVADGQCMLIVEQGKIVEVCAEPGEYRYDASTEPTIFAGSLGESISQVFGMIGKRFTFGGEAPKDQRIYYFNTKEITGNKYGTPNPIPFRVVDERAGIDLDIGLRCFGVYSYRITNPLLFYTNVCGNVSEDYERETIAEQLKGELLTALQPAFARIGENGVRYSALPAHTKEIAQALNEELTEQWKNIRGMEIVAFGIASVKASEEDEKMIKEMQRDASYMDPSRAASALTRAQADAIKMAASNQGAGSAMAFMGMGMAAQTGGADIQSLYRMGQTQQQASAQPLYQNQTSAQPAYQNQTSVQPAYQSQAPAQSQHPSAAQPGGWTCGCGHAGNTGKFCSECGNPKPEMDGWLCSCGTQNKGKFCQECGKPKPAGALLYRCDKCGWEPEDPAHPPKFCPECGDPFNDSDIKR